MKGIILRVFLGFQTDEFKNKSFGGSRNNYYYDGYEEMNHGDASSSMVNGNSSKLTMMSYFARFNYTFCGQIFNRTYRTLRWLIKVHC